MRANTIRTLRASLHRASLMRGNLHAKFHDPLPAPTVPRPPTSTYISVLQVPDLPRLGAMSAETLVAESLVMWRRMSHRANAMTAFGDNIVLLRTSLRDMEMYATRIARTLRDSSIRSTRLRGIVMRVANGPNILNAAAGMGLTAVITQEGRDRGGPESILRLLSSTDGPQKIGVGVLPAPLRLALANLLACVTGGAAIYFVTMFPQVVPWFVICVAVLFATRPDLHSFQAFTKASAPVLAKKKAQLVDKLRTQIAPYMMGLRPPTLADYGLFSVVTVVDHADYVYVYAGALSRWCLLGWYNMADDYNFDKILA